MSTVELWADDIDQEIIEKLNRSNRALVATGWLTTCEILNRLEQMDSFILLGDTSGKTKFGKPRPAVPKWVNRLDKNGNLRVKVHIQPPPGMMHMKLIIFGTHEKWTGAAWGSYNFTYNAKFNIELMSFTDDVHVILELEKLFWWTWNSTDSEYQRRMCAHRKSEAERYAAEKADAKKEKARIRWLEKKSKEPAKKKPRSLKSSLTPTKCRQPNDVSTHRDAFIGHIKSVMVENNFSELPLIKDIAAASYMSSDIFRRRCNKFGISDEMISDIWLVARQ